MWGEGDMRREGKGSGGEEGDGKVHSAYSHWSRDSVER